MNIYPHRSADSYTAWEGKIMWKTLRLYWIAARGYRLRPWASPYLQWRFETFLGREAANMTASKFFQLSWKYRGQLQRFADWSAERRRVRRRAA